MDSINDNSDDWVEWATCAEPQTSPLPLGWEEKLTNFEKMLILKCFRPEKLVFAVT